MCYTYIIKREEIKTMATWYQVICGACVCEQTFEKKEDAERKAHLLTCLSGHKWHVKQVWGWDR